MTDLETIRLIENSFGKRVSIEYQTINLGNGSEEEQESGEMIGIFTGAAENVGRTIRYEFETEDKAVIRYFLSIDEILSVEELEQWR